MVSAGWWEETRALDRSYTSRLWFVCWSQSVQRLGFVPARNTGVLLICNHAGKGNHKTISFQLGRLT